MSDGAVSQIRWGSANGSGRYRLLLAPHHGIKQILEAPQVSDHARGHRCRQPGAALFRKPPSEALGDRVDLRLSTEEKQRFAAAAEKSSQGLSAWIRDVLARAAKTRATPRN